jgi:hypothetical protein
MATELGQLDELLSGWTLSVTEKLAVFNVQCVADNFDAPLSELTFQDAPLWPADDQVHIAGPAYHPITRLINSQLQSEDDNSSVANAPKRPRLESVVVQREDDERRGNSRHVAAASWSTRMMSSAKRDGPGGGGGGCSWYCQKSYCGCFSGPRGHRGRGGRF